MNHTATLPDSTLHRAEPSAPGDARPAQSLVDLLYDGFSMLLLLKAGNEPRDAASFKARVERFLGEFERAAARMHAQSEDIHASKFAFCATVDEFVLSYAPRIRAAWERHPLQLALFGEQTAGNKFFDLLERFRAQGAARLASLETFRLCLLIGFRGKHVIEGAEKLSWLTSNLSDDIARIKGDRAGFAPHALPPQEAARKPQRELPVAAVCAMFALTAALAWTGFAWYLSHAAREAVAPFAQIIRLAPPQANLTILLP